jgi:hypothetical protein
MGMLFMTFFLKELSWQLNSQRQRKRGILPMFPINYHPADRKARQANLAGFTRIAGPLRHLKINNTTSKTTPSVRNNDKSI